MEKCVQGHCGSNEDLPFNAAQYAGMRPNGNRFMESEEAVRVEKLQICSRTWKIDFSFISLDIKHDMSVLWEDIIKKKAWLLYTPYIIIAVNIEVIFLTSGKHKNDSASSVSVVYLVIPLFN